MNEATRSARAAGDGGPPRPPARRGAIYAATIGLAAAWAAFDQTTKVIVVETLGDGRVIDLGILDLRHVRNPDGAFSLIPGIPGLFVGVTVVVLVVLARVLPRTERLPLALAYGLVAGGAIGNASDRVFRDPGFPSGHVVDFINFGWWPVFNVADIGIVTGAGLILLLTLRPAPHARGAGEDSAPPGDAPAEEAPPGDGEPGPQTRGAAGGDDQPRRGGSDAALGDDHPQSEASEAAFGDDQPRREASEAAFGDDEPRREASEAAPGDGER